MRRQKPAHLNLTILLLMLCCLAGCGQNQTSTVEVGGEVSPLRVECQVFYRSSVTVGIEREETVALTGSHGDQTVVFNDLTFHASFSTGEDPPNERGLRVWVTAAGREEELVAQLYQMPRTEAIRNQFVGDHGFTGLNYVYHPTSRAEMQYVCIAR